MFAKNNIIFKSTNQSQNEKTSINQFLSDFKLTGF